MEANDVSVFTTPDVPGHNFVAGCGKNLTYIFSIYGEDGFGSYDYGDTLDNYVDRATKDAKAIAAKLGWNCIVDFKPQFTLNGEGDFILSVPFTMGTLYED